MSMATALRAAVRPTALCRRALSTAAASPGGRSGNVPLRVLVIDGYAREGREELTRGGATQAGFLYRDMLHRCSPVGAQCDIVYPADEGFAVPDMSLYDGVAWTGCSLTIYANEERVLKQIRLAESIYRLGTPSFGSCWSCQIAAVAAPGGKCGECRARAVLCWRARTHARCSRSCEPQGARDGHRAQDFADAGRSCASHVRGQTVHLRWLHFPRGRSDARARGRSCPRWQLPHPRAGVPSAHSHTHMHKFARALVAGHGCAKPRRSVLGGAISP